MPTAAASAGEADSTRSRIDRVRTLAADGTVTRPSAPTLPVARPPGHSICTRAGRAIPARLTARSRRCSGSKPDRAPTESHVPRMEVPGTLGWGYGAVQAVAGSPSNADEARLPGLPW